MIEIAMSAPDITAEERRAVQKVLETSSLSIGPRIEEFEASICERLGIRHAIAVSSGTAGLHLGVIAAGVEDGDFVLTTPYSFVATSNVVLYERAVPIFVDVEQSTGNIDPDKAVECVEAFAKGGEAIRRWLPPGLRDMRINGRMRAILPVHVFGQSVRMQPILDVAARHELAVIEDACEAIGSRFQGRAVGTLGTCGVFAFYPNKQITTGEGGMIVTNSERLDRLFRSLRNQGRGVMHRATHHERLGYNYRLDEMSAALGVVQLQRFDELLAGRARVAAAYDEGLHRFDWIEKPHVASHSNDVSRFVYVVHIKAPTDRDLVVEHLTKLGIPSRRYFTPIHLQPFYSERFGYGPGDFPVAEHLGSTCIALPFSSVMGLDKVTTVLNALASFER